MTQATNYLEEWALNWVRGTAAPTAPSTLYLAASTADPTEDGSGLAEPSSGDGYARLAVTYGAPAARAMATAADQDFAPATNAWPQVTHWALCDAATAGNVLAYVSMDTPQDVSPGNPLRLPAGHSISFTGGIAEYFAHLILNWLRGTNMPAAPANAYGALSTTTPASDGSNLTEPSGNGYAREIVAFDAPVQGANAATIANSGVVQWGPASGGNWGDIIAVAVMDALTVGNMLFSGAQATQTVNDGSPAEAAAGAISLGIS